MEVTGENNISTPKIQKFIDIENVFKGKNPALAKLIPRFVYSYLKRLVHADGINYILNKHKDKMGLEFVDASLKEFGINIHTTGDENIPDIGRLLVVSNHPLGGADGLVIMHAIGKSREDIKVTMNDILLNIPNLIPLSMPINKHGSNSNYIQNIEDIFTSDSTIIFFPAGLVSRKIKSMIKDLPWKKTFITKSRMHQRDIVPVYINGRNSNFFYNLANLRKRLNIKSNIEMLFLVDEMYKQVNKIIEVHIGKSIPYQTFDKRYTDNEWALLVQDYVYKLKDDINLTFEFVAN